MDESLWLWSCPYSGPVLHRGNGALRPLLSAVAAIASPHGSFACDDYRRLPDPVNHFIVTPALTKGRDGIQRGAHQVRRACSQEPGRMENGRVPLGSSSLLDLGASERVADQADGKAAWRLHPKELETLAAAAGKSALRAFYGLTAERNRIRLKTGAEFATLTSVRSLRKGADYAGYQENP